MFVSRHFILACQRCKPLGLSAVQGGDAVLAWFLLEVYKQVEERGEL